MRFWISKISVSHFYSFFRPFITKFDNYSPKYSPFLLSALTAAYLSDGIFQSEALIFPMRMAGRCIESCSIPNGLLTKFEPDDIFLYFWKFVSAGSFVSKPISQIILQSLVFLSHHCVQILQFLLLPYHRFLHHRLSLHSQLIFLCTKRPLLPA